MEFLDVSKKLKAAGITGNHFARYFGAALRQGFGDEHYLIPVYCDYYDFSSESHAK
jgi:hypothetical protein